MRWMLSIWCVAVRIKQRSTHSIENCVRWVCARWVMGVCTRSPLSNLFFLHRFSRFVFQQQIFFFVAMREIKMSVGMISTQKEEKGWGKKKKKRKYSIVIRYVCFVFCAINFYAHSTFFFFFINSHPHPTHAHSAHTHMWWLSRRRYMLGFRDAIIAPSSEQHVHIDVSCEKKKKI